MNSTTGLILGFAGSTLVGILGFAIIKKHKRLKKTGIKVNGEIIDIVENPRQSNNDNRYYTPIIKFETKENETQTVKLEFSVDKYAYKVGQSLPLYYNPSNPRQFMVDDARSNFFGPFMLTLAIVGFIVCVVLTFVFTER